MTHDPIVEAVVAKLRSRSAVGVSKYGVTLQDAGLNRRAWLVHAQEEALDFANYIECLLALEDAQDRKADA